ncbi:MAG: hypothetical protein AB1486_21690 [Planctomycetota bacterium]
MPKTLAAFVVIAFVASGCSHLGLKVGYHDYRTDEQELGFADERGASAGLAFESNLTRYAGFETNLWYDPEVQKDGTGEFESADMLTLSWNFVFNLVPDQRPAENFMMDVSPVPDPKEDTDYPWIIAPLKWLQHGLPWLVPYVTGGIAWGHQFLKANSDFPGADGTRDEDYFFVLGGGFKIQASDTTQLRLSVDYYDSSSSSGEWLDGQVLRYGLTYSIPF